ncbi:MAG: hypothetical protein VB054_05665, partial [Petrimonas sp.]|nr:hypothetical protein [Petrimonas sp.]
SFKIVLHLCKLINRKDEYFENFPDKLFVGDLSRLSIYTSNRFDKALHPYNANAHSVDRIACPDP